jgi:hypothetical protein
VTANDRLRVVRDVYSAYESGDRQVVEQSLADAGDKISRVEVNFGWDVE